MLKVSIQEEIGAISLLVEGRLAGPWVSELETCWQRESARAAGRVLAVRLSNVIFIDDTGKDLLTRIFRAGARIDGNGCMVRAILERITGQSRVEANRVEAKNDTVCK